MCVYVRAYPPPDYLPGCCLTPPLSHPQALLPTRIERSTGATLPSTVSVGAEADSYYEYLLKYWILMGKQVGRERGVGGARRYKSFTKYHERGGHRSL